MTNLNSSLMMPLPKIHRGVIIAFFAAALIGFIDAAYLTFEHFLGRVPPCSILHGCEKVTTSPYAEVFGIPLALFGAIYYFTLLVLIIAHFDLRKGIILKLAALITPVGFLSSLYFIYLQLFVIKAICLYCMISAAASIALFILGMIILRAMAIDKTRNLK